MFEHIHGKTCVHQIVPGFRPADKNDAPCGKPAFARKAHGWLCIGHYKVQTDNLPVKPRLPQPRWDGLVPQRDEDIIADIIATDAAAIEAGTVVRITRGATDPVRMYLLEPAVVH